MQRVKVMTMNYNQHMMMHRVTFSLTCLTSSTSSCMAKAQSLSTKASVNGFPSQEKLLALVQPAFLAVPRTVHGMYCVSCPASCRTTCSAASLQVQCCTTGKRECRNDHRSVQCNLGHIVQPMTTAFPGQCSQTCRKQHIFITTMDSAIASN